MKFKNEVAKISTTRRDYQKYPDNPSLEPQDFLRIHETELADLIQRVNDYSHYTKLYGNATGVCQTGYPQHPDYVCGMCGQDRSTSQECLRLK